MDTERLEIGRRWIWRFAIVATLVVVAVLLGALWWDQRGFDPGDTLQVTARIAECGYVHIDASGEQWQSEDPRHGNVRGTVLGGTLERLTENEAVYRSSGEDPGLPMQRLRSDYFWPAGGCIEPDI